MNKTRRRGGTGPLNRGSGSTHMKRGSCSGGTGESDSCSCWQRTRRLLLPLESEGKWVPIEEEEEEEDDDDNNDNDESFGSGKWKPTKEDDFAAVAFLWGGNEDEGNATEAEPHSRAIVAALSRCAMLCYALSIIYLCLVYVLSSVT